MMKSLVSIIVTVFILQYSFAQVPQAGQAGPPPPTQSSAWENPTGPYKVVMEEDSALPNHTIYRPGNLDAFPEKDRLPIIAFTGPGCELIGTAFRPFYTEVASHGFLVIATGPPSPAMGNGANRPKAKSSDLIASVDWAIAENKNKKSKYYNRVDVSKIAVMGQSCGGLQTLDISQDPRITTLILWNSGVVNNVAATPNAMAGVTTTKEVLKTLRVPIAYFVGKTDMANPNALDDFERIETVPVFWGSLEIQGDAHAGTFREKNGGKFGVAGVAWLKWQLKGDENAARMFKGSDCGLCIDSEWEVKKKKID